MIIAYRKSDRNPGRYVETALERAGLEVRQVESIDWETIDPSALAVIVVESPLPALAVHGQNPGVPVIFWVHHGEHQVIEPELPNGLGHVSRLIGIRCRWTS